MTKQPSGSNTGTESRNFRQTFPHLQLGTCSNYQNSILRKGRCISCVTMLQPSETGVKSCKKWKGKSVFFPEKQCRENGRFPRKRFHSSKFLKFRKFPHELNRISVQTRFFHPKNLTHDYPWGAYPAARSAPAQHSQDARVAKF